jgi:hypothetical protein
MVNFTAVYDANILYSASLRDLFVELALTNLFAARWTEEIHSEWMRNVLKNRPERLFRDQYAKAKAFNRFTRLSAFLSSMKCS